MTTVQGTRTRPRGSSATIETHARVTLSNPPAPPARRRREAATKGKAMSEPAYVTMPQAAARLAVSADTIRRAIKRGDLPAMRIGRLVRIPAEALTEFERVDSASAKTSR